MARTRSARSKARSRSRAAAGGTGAVRAVPAQQRSGAAQQRQGSARAKASAQAAASAQATAEANGGAIRTRPAAGPGTAISGPLPWLRLTTLVLSLAGLGVSIYLTIAHFTTSVSLACPNTGAINCEKVTTSPQSYVFGIPVAVLGLAFFVFMVAVNNPVAWRARLPLLNLSRVLSVIVGMGFVLYLIYVELFKVNAICLWCTSVHVITFALFVITLLAAAMWGGIRDTAD